MASANQARVRVPRGPPGLLGDSGPWPGAHRVYQLSSATRALVRGPAGSISCPGRLGPPSEGRGFDQLSRATGFLIRGPTDDSCPRRLGAMTDVPLGRPAVPVESGTCLRATGVERLSRGIRAWIRVHECSTSYTGGLGKMPDCHQCPQVGPGDTGPGPRARIVDQLSRTTRVLVRGPTVDQLSRVTRAWVRGPSVSTSCSRNSGLCPSARGVDLVSWATRAHAQGPTGSTICPGQLRPGSEGPRC